MKNCVLVVVDEAETVFPEKHHVGDVQVVPVLGQSRLRQVIELAEIPVSAVVFPFLADAAAMNQLLGTLHLPRLHFVPKFIYNNVCNAQIIDEIWHLNHASFALAATSTVDLSLEASLNSALEHLAQAPLQQTSSEVAMDRMLMEMILLKCPSLPKRMLTKSMQTLLRRLRSAFHGIETYRIVQLSDNRLLGLHLKARLNAHALRDFLIVISESETLDQMGHLHSRINKTCGNVLKEPFSEKGSFCLKAYLFDLDSIKWMGLYPIQEYISLSQDQCESLRKCITSQASVENLQIPQPSAGSTHYNEILAALSKDKFFKDALHQLQQHFSRTLEAKPTLSLPALRWLRDRSGQGGLDIEALSTYDYPDATRMFFHDTTGSSVVSDRKRTLLLDCFHVVRAPMWWPWVQFECLLRFELYPYAPLEKIAPMERQFQHKPITEEGIEPEIQTLISAISKARQVCLELCQIDETTYRKTLLVYMLHKLNHALSFESPIAFGSERLAQRLYLGLLAEWELLQKANVASDQLAHSGSPKDKNLVFQDGKFYFKGKRLEKPLRGNGLVLFKYMYERANHLCERETLGKIIHPNYQDTDQNDVIRLNTAIHRMREHLLNQIKAVDAATTKGDILSMIELNHGDGYTLRP